MKNIKIMLWYDVEDFITPESDDALLALINMMDSLGIRGSFTTVTLMVQLSGIAATLTTLIAGTLSDKSGNRRSFISWGYTIWGVTVALFGFLSPELTEKLLGCGYDKAVMITLAAVVVGDCVMTLFGSTANDACFNAWVTDNTESSFRGNERSIHYAF